MLTALLQVILRFKTEVFKRFRSPYATMRPREIGRKPLPAYTTAAREEAANFPDAPGALPPPLSALPLLSLRVLSCNPKSTARNRMTGRGVMNFSCCCDEEPLVRGTSKYRSCLYSNVCAKLVRRQLLTVSDCHGCRPTCSWRPGRSRRMRATCWEGESRQC